MWSDHWSWHNCHRHTSFAVFEWSHQWLHRSSHFHQKYVWAIYTCSSCCSNVLVLSADLTSGFTHRVIGMQGIELVAPQSTTTLSVPNSVGSVKHQLWYKECLVKETAFTACKRAAPAVPSTQSAPQSTSPQGKTSGGLSLGFNYLVSLLSIIAGSSLSGTAMKSSVLKLALVTLVLVCLAQGQSTCQSVAVNDLVGADSVMQAEFGLNEDRTVSFHILFTVLLTNL